MNSGSIKNTVNLHGSIVSLGARGYSNYEIAVQNGFEGTEQEWLDSLVGPVGPRGPIGPNNFHVGEEEPEDENVSVWLDTDEPIPNTFVPVATEETLGTIKPGNNLKVDKYGKLEMTIYANNVEEMVNSKLKPHDVVRTLGYYEANDGGGALYLIREKTEDDVEDKGSIHFVGDKLVAELIVKNYINVKQFGAKGNGEDDDINSIEKALNVSKDIYFPTSIYLISRPINISNKYNIECLGTIKNNNGTCLIVEGKENNIKIKRLEASDNGIELTDINYETIKNNFIVNDIIAGNNAVYIKSTNKGIYYNNFNGNRYAGTNNSLYLHLPIDSTGFVTENFFENMFLVCTNGAGWFINNEKDNADSLSSNKIINVRFEGVKDCYHFINTASNTSINIRTNESITGKKIILERSCRYNDLSFGILSIADNYIDISNNTGLSNKLNGTIINSETLYNPISKYLYINANVMSYRPEITTKANTINLNHAGGTEHILELNEQFSSIKDYILCKDVTDYSVTLGNSYCGVNMIGYPIIFMTGKVSIIKDIKGKVIIDTTDTEYQNYKKVAITLMGINHTDDSRFWKKEIVS